MFENEHLLQRDKTDFDSYWVLLNYDKDKVEYHVGIDFTPQSGELIIVDEADTFMLNDPERFDMLIQEHKCLCFTATPDNCDPQGVEAKIISSLKF